VSKLTSVNASAVTILRRRRRGSTMAIPKKMFEEAQMVRRVRAYLSGLEATEDEVRLAEMSNQCEGPGRLSFLRHITNTCMQTF